MMMAAAVMMAGCHCSTAMLDYLLSQFDPEKKDEYQQYRALLQLIRGHVTK